MDLKLSILGLASAPRRPCRRPPAGDRREHRPRRHPRLPGARHRRLRRDARAAGPAFAARTTRPGHIPFGADPRGFEPREVAAMGAETPNGNSVSLEDQMMRAAEVRQEHDLALGVYAKSLAILRDDRHPALRRAGMDELTKTMAASASGMAAQAARLRLSTENIANADTPGYRRKTVSFEEAFQRGGDARAVTTGPVRLDRSELDPDLRPDEPARRDRRLLRQLERRPHRRGRRRPRGQPLLRGEPAHVRPGTADGELAPRPAPPHKRTVPMDIKATLASQLYSQVQTVARPQPGDAPSAPPARRSSSRPPTSWRRCARARRR